MADSWLDPLVDKLGNKYRLGNPQGDGLEIRYRFGKAEFRPTRFIAFGGAAPKLEVTIDIRIPKGVDQAKSDVFAETVASGSLGPRGFVGVDDAVAEMTSEAGKSSGFVRSLRFERSAGDVVKDAKDVRAVVESIDLPIIIGVHELEDLEARDPRPELPKKLARAHEPMENWEFTLSGGMLRASSIVINPNVRTLQVMERKLLSSKPVGDELKLAHVAKFKLETDDTEVSLIAEKKDGESVMLVSGRKDAEFSAAAGRMAKKVLIPIE